MAADCEKLLEFFSDLLNAGRCNEWQPHLLLSYMDMAVKWVDTLIPTNMILYILI